MALERSCGINARAGRFLQEPETIQTVVTCILGGRGRGCVDRRTAAMSATYGAAGCRWHYAFLIGLPEKSPIDHAVFQKISALDGQLTKPLCSRLPLAIGQGYRTRIVRLRRGTRRGGTYWHRSAEHHSSQSSQYRKVSHRVLLIASCHDSLRTPLNFFEPFFTSIKRPLSLLRLVHAVFPMS